MSWLSLSPDKLILLGRFFLPTATTKSTLWCSYSTTRSGLRWLRLCIYDLVFPPKHTPQVPAAAPTTSPCQLPMYRVYRQVTRQLPCLRAQAPLARSNARRHRQARLDRVRVARTCMQQRGRGRGLLRLPRGDLAGSCLCSASCQRSWPGGGAEWWEVARSRRNYQENSREPSWP